MGLLEREGLVGGCSVWEGMLWADRSGFVI